MEYDTARAGTFDHLRFVPKDKTVVLGLVISKESALEDQDEFLRRIEEASKFFPVENMRSALSVDSLPWPQEIYLLPMNNGAN